MENKNIWDEIAAEQATQRQVAASAKTKMAEFNKLPPDELVAMFTAICNAGEEFDCRIHIRWHIIDHLPDMALVNLSGLRMPVRLVGKIEKRLI